MNKPKSIEELLTLSGGRLTALKARSTARSVVLLHVCAALPSQLADAVISAGIEGEHLTIGVIGATWAARLRYATDALKSAVGKSLGVELKAVRIKVVPPP